MDSCYFRKRLISLKKMLKHCNKPISILNSRGTILYSNNAYDNMFVDIDIFKLIKHESQPKLDDDGSILHLNRNGQYYDVHISLDDEMNVYTVIVDDTSIYVEQEKKLIQFQEYHTNFIRSMYPKHVVDAIYRKKLECLSRHHKNVTICFADIKGFTNLCSTIEPDNVMSFLNILFGEFDHLLTKHNIYKLETVGDCYVTVSGLVDHKANGDYVVEPMDSVVAAENMLRFAKDMINTAYNVMLPGRKKHVELRVGIHTGNVTSGIIDNKMPKFSLFGDAMNMASRMETTGRPMHIHLSRSTYNHIRNKEQFKEIQTIVKGKGDITTYLLCCRNQRTNSSPMVLKRASSTSSNGLRSPSSSNVNLLQLAEMSNKCFRSLRKSFDI